MDTMILCTYVYFSIIVLIYVLVGLFTNCFKHKVDAWKKERDVFYNSVTDILTYTPSPTPTLSTEKKCIMPET